jgi:energy-coupling factor transporter ATP-binding protein EcfA2
MGPNGSGKTALLHHLAGVARAEGVGVDGLMPGAILASQYPEEQIFKETVSEELGYAARSRGRAASEAQRMAAEALEWLGITSRPFLSRRCWSLSGGEKRIVGVLGALLAPVPLILLDEPTGGLDPRLREGIQRLAVEASHRSAVVVATQDPTWEPLARGRCLTLGGPPPNLPSHSEKAD